jgi:hypothetical protein
MSDVKQFDPLKVFDLNVKRDCIYNGLSPENKKSVAVGIALDLIRAEVSSSDNTGADLTLNLNNLEKYRDQIIAALD